MNDKEFKDYLSSLGISSQDKQAALKFFKKADYFESLREKVNKNTNTPVLMGYGNLNSKICFVVQNKKIYESIKPVLTHYMDKFGINIWDVYITFVDKTEVIYPEKLNLLVHEVHAVNPDVLYLFLDNPKSYQDIVDQYKAINVSMPCKIFNIIVPDFDTNDSLLQQNFFDIFKYLINYKETE